MSTPKIQKQPLSVYTVMLIASAILMLAACILMAVEFARYGSTWKAPRAHLSPTTSTIASFENASLLRSIA